LLKSTTLRSGATPAVASIAGSGLLSPAINTRRKFKERIHSIVIFCLVNYVSPDVETAVPPSLLM
jgi:hypothetical protein